jgi:peptide/nickel transport system substrate-binding protein
MRISAKFLAAVSCVILVAFSINSCGTYTPQKNEVRIHELSDADMLNPFCYTDAGAGFMLQNIFQSLLAIDFKTLEVIPVLAESRPLVEKDSTGKLRITYKIRPEAVWDNGTPVTGNDVAFSVKVLKNPKVNNQNNKPYYEFIEDVIVDPTDPKKLTILCRETYLLAESSSGDYGIIPEYFYDPKGLMKGFTIPQLNNEKDKLAADPKISEFATDFNSEKRMREKDFILGSGAYKLAEWKTGERIILEKKKNWWGDKLENTNCYFQAYAEKLIHVTINDQTSALVSLKAGNLDVMRSIKSKDFAELPQSEKIKENFNLHTPMQLAYTYLGLNLKSPKFKDKKTRQALAHLLDIEKMIKTIKYGQAQRVIGFVHPSNIKDYNTDIKPYDYNPDATKQMLADAGWKDSNGDGVLDMMIGNERVEFTIDFSYNSGNDERKAVALMFQEEARKVGIKVNVIAQDWSVYLDNQKKHNFEMFFGAWIAAPVPNDPKQIYHSESALNEGSNYVSFGTPESDAVIDSVRVELDENKRSVLYKKLQQILHEEVSYIYLWAPSERIAIHKKYSNADASVMRPGYWDAGFKVSAQ